MAYVLVLDDDANMCRMVTRVLAGEGFETYAAKHPAEALACIVDRVPDVIISDFEMPGMNGATLLEQVRVMLHDQTPPAVLMSGALDAVRPSQRKQFEVHLAKPFRLEQLLAAVRQCLEAARRRPRRKRSGTGMLAVTAEMSLDEIERSAGSGDE